MFFQDGRDGVRITRGEFFEYHSVLFKRVVCYGWEKSFLLLKKAGPLEPDYGVELHKATQHRFVGVNGKNCHMEEVVLLDNLKVISAFEKMLQFFVY